MRRSPAEYFNAFFKNGVKVGELYTQLGINGSEHTGPERAARELLDLAKGEKEIKD